MSVSFCQTLFKLFFETFYFVSLYRSFLTTLLSYHDCRILSNTFLFFLSSLFHILTRDKKSTLRVRLFELERVKASIAGLGLKGLLKSLTSAPHSLINPQRISCLLSSSCFSAATHSSVIRPVPSFLSLY